jgi:GDPmannose 4,6-dehydratase
MTRVALITGITGMDGSYLAEFLLEKGYQVHGIIRRTSTFNTDRINHIFHKLELHYGDVTDPLVISNLVSKIQPDEVYNLAAQSHVKVSFEIPYYTTQVDGLGTLAILEAVKNHCPKSRIYQASTSELYGGMNYNMPPTGYNEESKMHPRSPYGVAKLYGLWITKNYRESYGMYISNGILFNHEGERRGETFVTRKITIGLSKIKESIDKGENFQTLKLGNLYSKRDWGYAKDFVEGMWLMLQQDIPDDYVLATGETHTIKEFVELACRECGWMINWIGEGLNERGVLDNGLTIVEIDEKYYRPAEVDVLLGDYSKSKEVLGWEPKTKFKDLVKIMMSHDIKILNNNE